MIPKEVIEDVRSRTDIVQLISESSPLTKRGENYVGLCPFLDHVDTSPSFSVSESKQIYKCFGCGRGGNAITFMMDYHGMTFIDSVTALAAKVGIDIPARSRVGTETGIRETLYAINETACECFREGLDNDALGYLYSRGLTDETVANFRIGFDNELSLSQFAAYPRAVVLDDSGLFIQKSDLTIRSKFGGRCTFPLIDPNGKISGFAGTNAGATPKYLNLRATALFNKSAFLYGLKQAIPSIKKHGAIVVEGYFDVLQMHQAGFGNVVASCGTSFTSEMAKLLRRYSPNVCLMFDGDAAGKKATDSAFVELFNAGYDDVWCVLLPDGEDPDSILWDRQRQERKDLILVSDLLGNCCNWFEFEVRFPGETRATIVARIRETADKIVAPDRRSLFLDLATEASGVSRESIKVRTRKETPAESQVPEFIIRHGNEILLLAALVKDRAGIERVAVEDFSCDETVTLFLAICQFTTEAQLYDGLSYDLTQTMTYILSIVDRAIDVDLALELVRGDSHSRNLKEMISAMEQAEISSEPLDRHLAKLGGFLQCTK
jgi:DNA primase